MTTDSIKELVKRLKQWGDGLPSGILLMREAASALEAMAGELAFVKAQLAGTNKNIAGWLQARDDANLRAAVAEIERDRLAGEVEDLKHDIARHMTIANEAAAERDRLKAAVTEALNNAQDRLDYDCKCKDCTNTLTGVEATLRSALEAKP